MGYKEFACNDSNEQVLDACGFCHENQDSDAYISDDGTCPEFTILGDVNGDESLNILDVVIIVNLVLSGNYDALADMNDDGAINILDITTLMYQILTNNGGQ